MLLDTFHTEIIKTVSKVTVFNVRLKKAIHLFLCPQKGNWTCRILCCAKLATTDLLDKVLSSVIKNKQIGELG